MAKEKEVKTNAMRMLDKLKLPYKVHLYECDEFIDGVHIAELLGESCDSCFKTLVTVGKSGNYYVFALPVDKELDMKKCARAVGEKSLEMVHVKDINAVTGYIRGGCTPIGMKKQYKTVIHKSALHPAGACPRRPRESLQRLLRGYHRGITPYAAARPARNPGYMNNLRRTL